MEPRSKQPWQPRAGAKPLLPAGHPDRRKLYSLHSVRKSRQSFDTERYLGERKAVIDAAVEGYLRQAPPVSPLLHEAICYSALDGGKRFRPILTLAVGELFGAKRAALLPFGSAIELIHCYSLVHDDLPALDNDDFRRGKPSCHKRFGEATALLAGDALLTEAFFIMSDPKIGRLIGNDRLAKVVREISEAAGSRGMVAGQSRELEIGNTGLTASDLEQLDRLKTGALITVAARAGAIIAGASGRDLDRITLYAQCLGLAFQITDDILDAHELEDCAAKNKAVVNYLSVAESGQAADRVRVLLDECLKELQPYGPAAEPLRALAQYLSARTD